MTEENIHHARLHAGSLLMDLMGNGPVLLYRLQTTAKTSS